MLEVSGVVAGYGKLPLARLSHLTVPPGEAAVLSGPSGTGKTTLLLAIAGLADLLEGQVEIAGQDMATLAPSARDRHRGTHIGMIFQDLHLVSGLSAIDNLLLAPYANRTKQDRQHALALLHELGLDGRVHAPAETLSRGEAQRAAIARAMLIGPSLVLADEPTASLDDEACQAVLDLLLATTRRSGAALVIATHDNRVRTRIPHVAMAEAA